MSITTLVFALACSILLAIDAQAAMACKDNAQYVYNNDPDKTCAWVKEKPSRRCSLVDKRRDRVRHQCQETCDSCFSRGDFERELTSSSSTYKQSVGQFCEQDSDCESWSCQHNTCYKSDECKPLKHFPGQRFDEDMIILIFVGSGFTDLDEWREQVAKTFNVFKDFEMFEYTNPLYAAFYVDELVPEGYCNFQCGGSPTLLCCDLEIARRLESKCFTPGAHVQTIVIENNEEYGGGGYLDDNMATTSIHELGPKVAVHELGHSLFELGDEYPSGPFTATWSANCDVEGCEKWADLDEHLGGGFCSLKGCNGGDYFVGEESFMQFLHKPFGEVNTRYSCCTYLAFTGSYPSYCDRYDFGDGLVEYCGKDYQHYGVKYEKERLRFDIDTDYSQGKYILVTQPAILLLDLVSDTYKYETSMDGEGPKVFSRRKYRGDFAGLGGAINEGVRDVKRVAIEFDSGEKHVLYFSQEEALEAPPFTDIGLEDSNVTAFANMASYLEVVIDARKGIVVGIDVEDLTIRWWNVILVGLSNIWKFIKNLFTKQSNIGDEHSDLHDVVINDRL